MQNDRVKVKKFCILSCHFDFWPLISYFSYCLGFRASSFGFNPEIASALSCLAMTKGVAPRNDSLGMSLRAKRSNLQPSPPRLLRRLWLLAKTEGVRIASADLVNLSMIRRVTPRLLRHCRASQRQRGWCLAMTVWGCHCEQSVAISYSNHSYLVLWYSLNFVRDARLNRQVRFVMWCLVIRSLRS